MKVVSVVGMTGAGKSEVSRVFEENNFIRIRFGDITDQEIEKRGLEPNEGSERYIRELFRRERGMAAYATLNLPLIDAVRQYSNVVIDGLYSWEEYTLLKDYYGEDLYIVAVWAAPKTRYARLANRAIRSLTIEEAISRDGAEIENVNKGGPIAIADFTIINESSLENLREAAIRVVKEMV